MTCYFKHEKLFPSGSCSLDQQSLQTFLELRRRKYIINKLIIKQIDTMYKNQFTYVSLLIMIIIISACSNSNDSSDPQNNIVKTELESSVGQISETLDMIHETTGYRIISAQAPSTQTSQSNSKNGEDPNYNINLTDVSGIYEYMPSDPFESDGQSLYTNLFSRTGDTNAFEIRVPFEKALSSWDLHVQKDGDGELTNNFMVSASEYQLIDNNTTGLDYTLNMSLNLDGEDAGNMYIRNTSPTNGDTNVDVRYDFTESVEARVQFLAAGSDISQEFSILENDEILYNERISGIFTSTGTILSFETRIRVDDIEFTKSSGSSNYVIYRNGERENNVMVTALGTCESPDQRGFCKEIMNLDITFADGTKINLATRLGNDALDKMESLFNSMQQIYLVQYLVDRVAIDETRED